MHSSRMRAGRALTVCWSLLPRGGVCSRGVSAPRGCLVQGNLLPGGVWSGGCLVWGVSARGVCSWGVSGWGLSALGGVWTRGVSAPGGYILACTEADPLPPVNRMTDRCKNITLATTSLRPVIKENVQNSKQKVTKNKLLELMKRILKG